MLGLFAQTRTSSVGILSLTARRAFASQSFQYSRPSSGNAPYKADRILTLNNIQDNPGARQTVKRVGRGRGGGLGKTSGRGHKGRKARAQQKRVWFEGGQTPLFKRTRKTGTSDVKALRKPLTPVSIDKIMMFVKQGRLDPRQTIDMKALKDSSIFANSKHGVVIIAKKENQEPVRVPLHLEVSWSEPNAKAAIEAAGGTVTHRFFNRTTFRAHLFPEKFPIKPRRDGVPKPKDAHKYPGLVDVIWQHRGLKEEEEALGKAAKIEAQKAKGKK